MSREERCRLATGVAVVVWMCSREKGGEKKEEQNKEKREPVLPQPRIKREDDQNDGDPKPG